MIRLIAPRCEHRRNPPSFRILMCRAHGTGCGRSWLATTANHVVEKRAARDSHEGACPGRDFTAPLGRATVGGSTLTEPRQSIYPVG